MTQYPEYGQASPVDDDMLSLAEIAGIFSRGKRWIVGTTLVFVAAALTYLFVVKPVYRSSALVKIEISQSSLILSLLGTGDAADVVPELSAAVEEMRSYDFIHDLIAMEAAENEPVPSIDVEAVAAFNERITIAEKGNSGSLIEIVVTGEDRDANDLVLRNLIDLYGNRLGQRLTRSINNSLVLLTDRLERIEKEIELFKSEPAWKTEITELNNLERTLTDLNHEINFLNRALELAKNGLVIVSRPVSENDPIRPKYTLVMILATMLGAMMGILLVLLRAMTRTGLRTAEAVERRTAIPVLGSIATNDIEGLKVLRTNILYRLSQSDNNRVMVCGPRDGVGKRYIAIHLAKILSEGGKKVLLVDADLRHGDLSTVFADARGGVSLAGCLQGKDVSPMVVNDNLHVLAGRDYPDMPSELLMNPRFEQLLGQMSKGYDAVLMHVPPVLSVTDAALVGAHCANTLMVVRAEQTTVHDIEAADRRLQQAGVAGICCVLNGVSA